FADDGPRHIRIEEDRVQSIRAALLDRQDVLYDNVPVGYVVPWGMRTLDRQSIDLVVSQASLQNLTHDADGSELAGAFAAMSRWPACRASRRRRASAICPKPTTRPRRHTSWPCDDSANTVRRGAVSGDGSSPATRPQFISGPDETRRPPRPLLADRRRALRRR